MKKKSPEVQSDLQALGNAWEEMKSEGAGIVDLLELYRWAIFGGRATESHKEEADGEDEELREPQIRSA